MIADTEHWLFPQGRLPPLVAFPGFRGEDDLFGVLGAVLGAQLLGMGGVPASFKPDSTKAWWPGALVGAGHFENPGQKTGGLLVPAAQAVNAFVKNRVEFVAVVAGEFLDVIDVVRTVLQVWLDCLAQEAAEQVAHAQFGLKEAAAVPRHVDLADGIDFLQQLQPLTGAAFADSGAGNDLIEADWLGRTEENAEDFSVRPGEPQCLRQVDEEMHDFPFDLGDRFAESSGSLRGMRRSFHGGEDGLSDVEMAGVKKAAGAKFGKFRRI